MRELGGELWCLVGLIVDVIRWGVELDPRENGDSFNLGEISRDQLVPGITTKKFVTLEVAEEAPAK